MSIRSKEIVEKPETSGARPADGHKISQIDKFKPAAKELETDKDANRFKEPTGKLVKHTPVEKGE